MACLRLFVLQWLFKRGSFSSCSGSRPVGSPAHPITPIAPNGPMAPNPIGFILKPRQAKLEEKRVFFYKALS